jgi:uncharacterized protein
MELTMSIEDKKQIVRAYLDHFASCDVDAVLGMMTDDSTWWVNGKPELYPDAGTRTKPEMERAWRELFALLNGGLRMEVVSMVAEGDRVAAEVRSHAITREGRLYDNGYHMLFTLRDRQIASVREYTDLLFTRKVFGQSNGSRSLAEPV